MSREAWIALIVIGAVVALATLVCAVVLVVRLLGARRMLGELGAGGKVAFYGALAYTLFPVDLLPDPIYLDDMGVLAAALMYLTHLVRKGRTAGTGVESVIPMQGQPRASIRPTKRPS